VHVQFVATIPFTELVEQCCDMEFEPDELWEEEPVCEDEEETVCVEELVQCCLVAVVVQVVASTGTAVAGSTTAARRMIRPSMDRSPPIAIG
jgi:hypothetical protein